MKGGAQGVGAAAVLDYAKLGFMCGLEVHQRLATKQKLFCACPAEVTRGHGSGTIFRYQRAVAGELGNVDLSAQFEEMRRRKFIYNLYEGHTCLVDIDEEPPHPLNTEALEIALSVAAALGLKISDELEPMRKEVVDGSNPSAFQRTILLGTDGAIRLDGHEIGITMMSLEEESAGISAATQDSITYDSDRIGIPLVEIDTDPHIASPQEAKQVALHIGTLLRLTGRVQRGIGTIRQDVNVSIKGGARVEIKGMQKLDTMDRFIENEVLRQQRLLELRDELVRRKASVGEVHDLTKQLSGTKAKIISAALGSGGSLLGLALHGFSGMLGAEVNPGRRLGTEISDYAKMGGVKGLIHSDEDMNGYGLTDDEAATVRRELKLKERDAFILIAGANDNASKAIRLAADRARQALVGVPLETRGVASAETFTTKFMRPLPGGARMYPETDVKPVGITKEMLEKAAQDAPDIAKERARLVKELGNEGLAGMLMMSQRLQIYKMLTAARGSDREFIANTLLQKFTELRRAGYDVESIPEGELSGLFRMYAEGKLTKQAVEEVLKELARGKRDAAKIVKAMGLERVSGKALASLVDKVRKEAHGISGKELVQRVMREHRLNVDGAELNALVDGK